MAFEPKTWKDDKTGKTPIKASELNRMEKGIANAVEKNSEAALTNVVSRNLFNKNEGLIQNANIDADGKISSNASTFYQETYISVEPNTKYTVSSGSNAIYRIAEYNSSKTFIKRTYNVNSNTKYTITTSNTTKFVRLAIDNSVNIDTIMFAEGEDTNYTPYLNLKEVQEKSKIEHIAWSKIFDSTKINISDVDNRNEITLVGNTVIFNVTGNIVNSLAANTYIDIGNMKDLSIEPNKNISFYVLNSTKMLIGLAYFQKSTGNIRLKIAAATSSNDEIILKATYTID